MKAKLEVELLENMHEYTISFNGIKRAISKRCYNTLKEMFELNQQCLLQPIAITQLNQAPSEEEVCNALSKWLNIEVKYNYGNFYYGDNVTYFEIADNDVDDVDGNRLHRINIPLPPRLITMIGRFYEGRMNNE